MIRIYNYASNRINERTFQDLVVNGLSDFDFSDISVSSELKSSDMIHVVVKKNDHELTFSLEALSEAFLVSNGLIDEFKLPNSHKYTRFKVLSDTSSTTELLEAALTITGAYFWIVLIESDYLMNKLHDIPSGIAIHYLRPIEVLDSNFSAYGLYWLVF
ncbi:hypothetical protein M3223_18650 [Paenibacillus pasadenensis]|uniref:hypothetical protein n=1 Tax=Paenibacillus pasadenensis TaxID=217090 RepID=UPI00203B63C5|nr:hypothetical protein [Paenibacillus pasadenensis]MCM3749375.1 hypothetical protein [Paenibacillus pasadenensis]